MSKNSKQVATSEPWKEIRPFLLDTARQGANLAANDGFVPLPRMGEQTRGALSSMGQMARNNPYLRDATQGLTNFANSNIATGPVNFAAMNGVPSGGGVSAGGKMSNGGGGVSSGGKMSNSAPGGGGGASSGGKMSANRSGGGVSSGGKGTAMADQIRALQPANQQRPQTLGDSLLADGSVAPVEFRTPARTQINYADSLGPAQFEDTGAYAGIDAMRDSISARVLPQVAGMFGQGGFANSTMAQQTAADALGNALAGFEYNQFNTNRQRDDSNTQFNTQFGAQQQARGDANQEFNAGLRQDYLARNDANRMFNTQLLSQQQARSDQNAMFNQGVSAADIERGLTRDMNAIQMAPQLSAMRYNDIAALGQVGAQRDAFRAARDGNQRDNLLEQANFFASLGGLGGVQSGTQSPGALGTIGALGQLGLSGAIGANLLGFGGGAAAGAGGAFGAGTLAAGPALAGLSSLGPLAALSVCDRRLKTDIEPTPYRTFKTGSPVYTFRYLWDDPDVRRIGPMAQEVPVHARVTLPSGFLAVDMGAL